jgi:hypothetical protein
MSRGRPKKFENMTPFELAELQTRVIKAKIEARNAERNAVRSAITAVAKEHGFNVKDLISR